MTPGERAEVILYTPDTDDVEIVWHDLPIGYHNVFEKQLPDTGIGAGHSNPLDGKRAKQVMMTFGVTSSGSTGEYEPPEGLVVVEPLEPTVPTPLEYSFSHGAVAEDGSVPFFGQIVDGVKTSFEDLTPEDAYTLEVGETYIFEISNPDGYGESIGQYKKYLFIILL